MDELEAVRELDAALIAAAKDIKVLSALSWPVGVQRTFLDAWERDDPRLPEIDYRRVDGTARLVELDSIATRADRLDHPLGRFVRDTARSYHDVARMLSHLGEPEFSDLSVAVYGRPGDALTGGRGTTSVDAARFFLTISDEFYQSHPLREADLCVPPEIVRQTLESRLSEVFGKGAISVVVDPTLPAKAAAGASRIRLRDATCFSEYDLEQLLQHEAFVHSLTAQNGRLQSSLRSMSLGAPRTTAAQEGLATFAELVTGAIDMARLERIAMRIVAIDMALGGADFIDVFRYFVKSGQPASESFNSTMRVFRGAPVTGGYAFTKDAVYLHGLLEVHTFFRWALREQRLTLCERFFAGRMTLGDTIRYEGQFADGDIAEPNYLPPWMTRTTGLAGYLAFSVFANSIDLGELSSAHEFEALDR